MQSSIFMHFSEGITRLHIICKPSFVTLENSLFSKVHKASLQITRRRMNQTLGWQSTCVFPHSRVQSSKQNQNQRQKHCKAHSRYAAAARTYFLQMNKTQASFRKSLPRKASTPLCAPLSFPSDIPKLRSQITSHDSVTLSFRACSVVSSRFLSILSMPRSISSLEPALLTSSASSSLSVTHFTPLQNTYTHPPLSIRSHANSSHSPLFKHSQFLSTQSTPLCFCLGIFLLNQSFLLHCRCRLSLLLVMQGLSSFPISRLQPPNHPVNQSLINW